MAEVHFDLLRVDDVDLEEIEHCRRLVLRAVPPDDPDRRWVTLQAVGIPYVLCPCGAHIGADRHWKTATVLAVLAGWRVEVEEHRCQRWGAEVVTRQRVLRCPTCLTAEQDDRREAA